MTINQKYRKASDVLVNYDFADLLSNVGYVTLYGMTDEADAFKLSRQALTSTLPYKDYAYVGAGNEKRGEQDFDYTFLSSQLVKGTLYVTHTTWTVSSAYSWTKITIIHYDGTTETIIGAQQEQDEKETNNTCYTTTYAFAVDKQFKKGDILRINVEIWGNSAGVAARLYFDGANRDFSLTDIYSAAGNSNFIVLVPFDLGGKL